MTSTLARVLFQPRLLLLGIISFFTDVSSEMLYPILPLYLISVGFDSRGVGLLEGLAEAVVSLAKGFFGSWSDRIGRRLPFIRVGYALSNITRPLIGLMPGIVWIFLQRLGDRLGKGIRTGARDALLAETVPSEHRGLAFGFHRSMDTLGAVVGPLVAMYWLKQHPGNYRALFFIAFAPAAVTMLFSFMLSETPTQKNLQTLSLLDKILYWRKSSLQYKKVSAILLSFSLLTSSQMFFLLMLKEHGLSETEVVGLYAIYNVVYAALAVVMGRVADRVGAGVIVRLGMIGLSISFLGFSFAQTITQFTYFMLILGFTSACVEGNMKAWLSMLAPKQDLGAALGGFATLNGLTLLIGNTLMGFSWSSFGADRSFQIFGSLGFGLLIISLLVSTRAND